MPGIFQALLLKAISRKRKKKKRQQQRTVPLKLNSTVFLSLTLHPYKRIEIFHPI